MAVNETGAERGSSLVFLCVGGGGEQVVLRVDCGRGPPPTTTIGGGGACLLWGSAHRVSRTPLMPASLWSPGAAPILRHVLRAHLPRVYGGPARRPQLRLPPGGAAGLAGPHHPAAGRRPARPPGHPGQSLPTLHPSPWFFLAQKTFPTPPFRCVQMFGCAMGQ